jgi:AcrR family transcriptional regulator
MDAALEAFGEKGYFPVTVDDIVTGAGISRATFYLHFDSKAAVLRTLRDSRWVSWPETNNPRWGAGERVSIRTFFENVMVVYTEAPVLHKSLHEARAADPEFADEYRHMMERHVTGWLESGQVDGVDVARVRLAVAMTYTMLDYFMNLWIIQGWQLDRDAALDAMTDALHAIMS